MDEICPPQLYPRPPSHNHNHNHNHNKFLTPNMFSILKFSTLALWASVSAAQSCDVEDGVTVTSSTFPQAEGCYEYSGQIDGFDAFLHEDGEGAILPGTRFISAIGETIDRWVFFPGAAGEPGSTICYTDGFPSGNPGDGLTEVVECEDGTLYPDVQFSCGCDDPVDSVDTVVTSPTPAPVTPVLSPVGNIGGTSTGSPTLAENIGDTSTGSPTPSPEDVVFLTDDDSFGSPTKSSSGPTGSPTGSPAEGVDDSSQDEEIAVDTVVSSGNVATVGIISFFITIVGAFFVA